MTASLYEKNGIYQVMISWYEGKSRRRKSISTGLSVAGKNKRKAEAEKKKILAEWEAKMPESYEDELFSDYLLDWLETKKYSISETTYYNYKKQVEKQICPYFAERKITLNNLTPSDIQDFYNDKLKNGKGKNGNSTSGNTIRHYQASIHNALKQAVILGRINYNPSDRVILPKKVRPVAEFYTADELKALLEAVQGTKLETPVVLASWFGLRRGEICGLRWKDIDLDNNVLSVNGVVTDKGQGKQTDNLTYRSDAKTSTSIRSFPIPAKVKEYLLNLKVVQENNRELAGNSYNPTWKGFVCVDDLGNLIQPGYITQMFPEFLKQHDFRHIRFHDLRHTNVSLLVNQGVDMKRIQSWTGHADYSTTANTYAHLLTNAKVELGDAISSVLD